MIDKLLVMGASGDLAGRYLLPALAHLQEAGRLPQPLAIVGVACDDWDTAAFRRHLAAQFAVLLRDCPLARPSGSSTSSAP